MGSIFPPGNGGGGGGGTLVNGANVGTGPGLSFRDITGGITLNLRTFLADTNIGIATVGDEIIISYSNSGAICAGFNDANEGTVALGTQADCTLGNFLGAGGCVLVVPNNYNYWSKSNSSNSYVYRNPANTGIATPANAYNIDLQLSRVGGQYIQQRESVAVGKDNSANGAYLNFLLGNNNTSVGSQYRASTCIGFFNVSGADCVSIGAGAYSALRSAAIGHNARATIESVVFNSPLICRSSIGDEISGLEFNTAEVTLLSPEVDLKLVADNLISIPVGASFFVNEVGVFLTSVVGTLATQPTVRFGINGTPNKFVAPTQTSLLTNISKRQLFSPIYTDDGETSLVAGVTIGASGTGLTFKGRFYFKGLLLENQPLPT